MSILIGASASKVFAQEVPSLYEEIVQVIETELGYVYDSTSNQRRKPVHATSSDSSPSPGIHDHFLIIDNPSPLVFLNGKQVEILSLKKYLATETTDI
ncbi:MAG: hypothetical protein WBA23_11900 [Tunicatimonas sp.]|uniref:hypothetical protein n=1 Tax=Tunicatimonas sp. TaxID=1940096 RepID=UPI003C744DB8